MTMLHFSPIARLPLLAFTVLLSCCFPAGIAGQGQYPTTVINNAVIALDLVYRWLPVTSRDVARSNWSR